MTRTAAIMRAALRHLHANHFNKPPYDTMNTSFKIDPAGITGSLYDGFTDDGALAPASETVRRLADALAAMPWLGAAAFEEEVQCEQVGAHPVCWSDGDGLVLFVVASVPEVHDDKARLRVRVWEPPARRDARGTPIPIGSWGTQFELERGPDGQWQVTGRGVTVVS
jgi:hypothetical protein